MQLVKIPFPHAALPLADLVQGTLPWSVRVDLALTPSLDRLVPLLVFDPQVEARLVVERKTPSPTARHDRPRPNQAPNPTAPFLAGAPSRETAAHRFWTYHFTSTPSPDHPRGEDEALDTLQAARNGLAPLIAAWVPHHEAIPGDLARIADLWPFMLLDRELQDAIAAHVACPDGSSQEARGLHLAEHAKRGRGHPFRIPEDTAPRSVILVHSERAADGLTDAERETVRPRSPSLPKHANQEARRIRSQQWQRLASPVAIPFPDAGRAVDLAGLKALLPAGRALDVGVRTWAWAAPTRVGVDAAAPGRENGTVGDLHDEQARLCGLGDLAAWVGPESDRALAAWAVATAQAHVHNFAARLDKATLATLFRTLGIAYLRWPAEPEGPSELDAARTAPPPGDPPPGARPDPRG